MTFVVWTTSSCLTSLIPCPTVKHSLDHITRRLGQWREICQRKLTAHKILWTSLLHLWHNVHDVNLSNNQYTYFSSTFVNDPCINQLPDVITISLSSPLAWPLSVARLCRTKSCIEVHVPYSSFGGLNSPSSLSLQQCYISYIVFL
jgi:hypothetical protein